MFTLITRGMLIKQHWGQSGKIQRAGALAVNRGICCHVGRAANSTSAYPTRSLKYLEMNVSLHKLSKQHVYYCKGLQNTHRYEETAAETSLLYDAATLPFGVKPLLWWKCLFYCNYPLFPLVGTFMFICRGLTCYLILLPESLLCFFLQLFTEL